MFYCMFYFTCDRSLMIGIRKTGVSGRDSSIWSSGVSGIPVRLTAVARAAAAVAAPAASVV